MTKFIRFFLTGPGVVLVVVAIAITVAWIIREGQDKQRVEAQKHQVQRPLGQVKASGEVDKSTANKEVILSNRRLNPPSRSEPELPVRDTLSVSAPIQRGGLPALVSFYTQVAATPSPTPTGPPPQPKPPLAWLPPSIFIPCALVNTVESSHINTPVVGEVIRDVVQDNDGVRHLIVPAGTIVSSFAESGAVRDRIEVAGVWLFVFPDGRQLKIPGMACVREADPSNQQFGAEDGTAGLQGELVESDHWANAKALLALLITTTAQAGTAVASSAVQASHTTGVLQVPDTTPILAKYLDQLFNGETGDGRFVRVRAGTEFYIFPTDTILPGHRSVVTTSQVSTSGAGTEPVSPSLPIDPVQAAMQMEREILKGSQQPQTSQDASQSPKFHY